MTAIEATREWRCEAEVNRVAGEIVLMSPEPDAAKAQTYFERALAVAAWAAGKVVGAARGDQRGAAVARPGQAG
jgi:hypothetical protein